MRIFLPLACLAAPALAQDAPLEMSCHGTAPEWSLISTAQGATFTLIHASDLTLQLTTVAQGAEWPRAFTFIGRGDSAIVILEGEQDNGSHPARVLTQRGETPLLLTGSCELG